jgi:hypothetical protein
MDATTLSTADNRDLQRAHERRNRHLHRHGLGTIPDGERTKLVGMLRLEEHGLPAGSAASQCSRCGDAFTGRTTRLAIAARREHERRAHGVVR